MMNIGEPLRSALVSKAAWNTAELFTIYLKNGRAITATTHGEDITINFPTPRTFYATKYGVWARGAITKEANIGNITSNSMPLTVTIPNGGVVPVWDVDTAYAVNDFVLNVGAQYVALAPSVGVVPGALGSEAFWSNVPLGTLVLFPGTFTPLLTTASRGLFDGADVLVESLWWGPINQNKADASLGVPILQRGKITKVDKLDRSQCVFSVSDYLYLLNQQIPLQIIQAPCRHTLYDTDGKVGCRLSRASFAITVTLAGGSTNSILVLTSSLPHAAPYYDLGTAIGLTGKNTGLPIMVKRQDSSTVLELVVPLKFTIASGDTFSLAPGCDKTLATCISKFNNKINFGGQPFTPPPETIL